MRYQWNILGAALNFRRLVVLALATGILALGAQAQDTPAVRAETKPPTSKYKHGDRLRPRPTVVTPPTTSTPDAPGKPPSDAVVLFDGTDLSQWALWNPRAKDDLSQPAPWLIHDGYAEVARGSIQTRQKFTDCHFHLEWRTSPEEAALADKHLDQHRSNSGVFIGDHPEIQVLDSFANDTYPDGQAAAIYSHWPPLVNASRKPGEWQSYDIFYLAPKFQNGTKVKNATYTVLHNGLPVHHHVDVPGEQTESRLRLQAHGGKVQYRNIWVRPMHQYDENEGKPLPADARTTNPFPPKARSVSTIPKP